MTAATVDFVESAVVEELEECLGAALPAELLFESARASSAV